MLTLASLRAVVQRGDHCQSAMQTGVDVGVATGVVTHFVHGALVVTLHNIGQPGLGMHGRGKRRAVAPWSGLTVSADRDINDVGIKGGDVVVAESESRQGAWPEVFDDHIGFTT